MGNVLAVAGLFGVVVGVIALIRGRMNWTRIHSRRVAAMAPTSTAPETSSAADTTTSLTPSTPTSTATTTTASPTPTPTTSSSPTPTVTSVSMLPPPPLGVVVDDADSANVALKELATLLVKGRAPMTGYSRDQVDDADSANVALKELATLLVKGRAPMTGYSRDQFGPAWTDDVTVAGGHSGCDTRNDVLRRDLKDVAIKPGSNGCAVLTGTLHDPYTGTIIAFVRGTGTSTAVQIDHVVALGNAWVTGGQQLTAEQRQNLANDAINLQATDGPTNEQKGDGDAATWLPPNKSYRCTYVARQVQIKAKYDLWVTAAEHAAIAGILRGCGGTVSASTAPPPSRATTTASPTTSAPRPIAAMPSAAPSTQNDDVYYANCAAVRAAGKAPLHVGQPGYRAGLDRDHDGVACEN